MKNIHTNKGVFTETYNTAIGQAYYTSMRRLIRKYYSLVSEAAINEYLRTGDFAQLTAEELLLRSGIGFSLLENEAERIATKFVVSLELKSNADFRKAFHEADKPIPAQLSRPIYSQQAKNLISQQVQKIKGLEQYQYQRINESLQEAIVQGKNITSFQQSLKEAGIYDDKRIKTIAFNQLNYATTVVNRNKATELGLNQAIWRHPGNNVYKTHPRPSHKEADGKLFKLDKGCKIDDEYILPAELPNCKCFYQIII